MRSQSGSSLSTLMFFVPLLGVPLMAIFGVPQFVPAIASSLNDESSRPTTTRRSTGIGESVAATPFVADKSLPASVQESDQRIHDVFRSAEHSRRDSRPIRGASSARKTEFVETSLSNDLWSTSTSASRQPAEVTPALNDLFGTAVSSADRPPSSNRTRAASVSNRGQRFVAGPNVASSERSDEGLTWREAVRRLNELGIQDFRLEPGQQLGEFYFACEFAPDRDARITRRFEAEASEPLLAVAAVLRQIDNWLLRRGARLE